MVKLGTILLILIVGQSLFAELPEGYHCIFVAPDASREVLDAADDLADLLKRTFGQRPQLLKASHPGEEPGIWIGVSESPVSGKLEDPVDRIRIERTHSGLRINGLDDASTCFAIYRFAEVFLGWRLYQPGVLGLERIDRPPELPSVAGAPTILLEESSGYFSRNLQGLGTDPDTLEWQKWNRLRERFSFNHSLYKIITPDLFETHPGWFSKDPSGKPKRPQSGLSPGIQDHPDLSNPGLREHVTEVTLKALANPEYTPLSVIRSPGTISLSLSLGDSYEFGSFSSSYEWRPDGYFRRWPDWSNHVFDYTNAIATSITDQYPHGDRKLYLGALAYLNWENIPDFPLHPSIVPYLTYDRSQWYDPLARADDLANLARWSNTGVSFLGTWDYLFSNGFLIPRSLCTVVSESIPLLYQKGVRAYFCQTGPVWAYGGHTSWLSAQLLWNPQADPESLLDEYFSEYYGPAAVEMRSFFDLAESFWMRQSGRGWWLRYWKDPWQAALWSKSDLDRLDKLLKTALEKSRIADTAKVQGLSAKRFYKRIKRTADLFAVTKQFHEYQHATWALQSIDWNTVSDSFLVSGKQRIASVRNRKTSLSEHLDLFSGDETRAWVYQYDALDATAAAWKAAKDTHSGKPPVRALYDTDLSEISNPRIWQQYFLDSEGLARGVLSGNKGFFVENSRRGHIYQLFRAQPGEAFLATADVFSNQSPSAMIYIRMDFFDAQRNQIGSSSRGRLSPSGDRKNPQHLRAYGIAPEGTVRGRVLIRFFEMDPGSRAEVYSAEVFRIPPVDCP